MALPTGDTQDEDTTHTKACPHVSAISLDHHRKRFHGGTEQQCQKCGLTRPYVWACLGPGCQFYGTPVWLRETVREVMFRAGCGRRQNKHLLEHFEQSGQQHCLGINLSSAMIWCYICDKEVLEEDHQVAEDVTKLQSLRKPFLTKLNDSKTETADNKPMLLQNGSASGKVDKRRRGASSFFFSAGVVFSCLQH